MIVPDLGKIKEGVQLAELGLKAWREGKLLDVLALRFRSDASQRDNIEAPVDLAQPEHFRVIAYRVEIHA